MTLELLKSVQTILELVKNETNKGIEFIEKADLPTFAAIKIARNQMPNHLIYYKTVHTDIINHLISHECGHVLRIHSVPDEKRFMPSTSDKTKLKAFLEMETQIHKLSLTLPFEKLTQIMNLWYAGIIRQVTNTAPDIKIEKWLYDEYPELRPYQLESIKKQQAEAIVGLSDKVRALTPRKIFDASNTMNYAFFRMVGNHINLNLVKPYYNSDYLSVGKRLVKLTEEDSANNYESDIAIVNCWAAFLDLSNWFEWTSFENVPSDYLQTF